jgi:protein TonB
VGFGPLAPRVVALVATTLLHALAVAALVVAYGARETGKTAQPLRLTLMTLSAPPPSRPVRPLHKPADAPRRSPERQIVAIPAHAHRSCRFPLRRRRPKAAPWRPCLCRTP